MGSECTFKIFFLGGGGVTGILKPKIFQGWMTKMYFKCTRKPDVG